MAISLFKPILEADFVTMANVKVEKKKTAKLLHFGYSFKQPRGIWKVLSMVLYLSNRFTNPIMCGIILQKRAIFPLCYATLMSIR